MDSVLVDSSAPDHLHSNFSRAANGAAQDIQNFTQLVEDGKTKKVLEKAKQSMEKNGEGITGWKVTEHEDWLDVKGDGNDDVDEDEEITAEVGDGSSMESTNMALDRFRSVHAGIEASLDESSRTVTVSCSCAFLQSMLRRLSSIYLRHPVSTSRFGEPTPRMAMAIIALTAEEVQSFKERFLK